MQVLAMMNAIHNFISGEGFFRPMLDLEREAYIARVKETLRFILIPAFAGKDRKEKTRNTGVRQTGRPTGRGLSH
jgi:hypothetical protein